jgi:two-component system, NtrC family, sensor histidine kinase PilS
MNPLANDINQNASVILNEGQRRVLILEFVRVGIYALLLLMVVLSQFAQTLFFNWDFLSPLYSILLIGFTLHIAVAFGSNFFLARPKWMMGTFFVDVILISFLIYFSGLNQSFFLFMFLVNILLAGLAINGQGAILVALFSSIGFTLNSILGPEIKTFSNLFMIVLNNIAFFSVAGVAGYLSEQLDFLGIKLLESARSLSDLKNLQELILGQVPVGVLTVESSGEIVQANKTASGIFLAEDIKGKNIIQLLPSAKLALEKLKEQDRLIRTEISAVLKDSTQVLAVTLTWLISGGQKKGILFVIENVTQIRRMEYSLRQSEKMAAVGQLAAGIAHEIRNPLASISGSVEMLSQTTSSDDDRKLMKIILREIDRLNNLITEFLDYSKPPVPPDKAIVINELVDEVLESMKLNSKIRSDVDLIYEKKSAIRILADKDKLKQALLNIVINAYQAMESTEKPTFRVQVWEDENRVSLSMRDNGCGMSEETKKRIFEPFHTTKAKGTGLGLAITHKIFENHKAEIIVETEVGKGTEFLIRFPKILN